MLIAHHRNAREREEATRAALVQVEAPAPEEAPVDTEPRAPTASPERKKHRAP